MHAPVRGHRRDKVTAADVFVAMEIGSRRILHCNVTTHPTAEWTIQQFREFLAFDHRYRFLIHDRNSIFSASLDDELKRFGVARIEDAGSRAPSERVSRATHRDDSQGMSGLDHCVRRRS